MIRTRLGGGCWCGLRCERWCNIDDGRRIVEVAIAGETAAGLEEVVAGQFAVLVKLIHIAVRAGRRFGGDGAEKFD